ncbi:uncharacterized protein N7484_011144 [Penicillium longicatenatum]|uniref:uncharacterized protein n=1 Tax=Penicillium longicatenatum TaxID=1561947 RepID=UPI002547F839|nr:uncharacterized protein N7484_011144 [Penicillium longicatenatum]KAJ5631044.1 hypothetical protein N7484_011144 [Penicillium longicatenatum]
MASSDTEPPVVIAELVNLLKEIKELLKARNNQLEGSSTSPFDNSRAIQLAEKSKNDFPSALNIGAETLVRDSQCATPAARPSYDDTARYSSGNDGVEDSLHPDGADRTRYYMMPYHRTEVYTFKPFTMLPCPVETRESLFIAGSSWKYWRPIAEVRNTDVAVNSLSPGRGYPNYVPEWEIIQVDREWYHIDGMKLSSEIDFSPDDEFEEEERLVPYSLLPCDEPETHSALSGLNDLRGILSETFGNLHSAPAHTIYFAFDKDRLRDWNSASSSSSFSRYLASAQSLFKLLENHGGAFEIADLDDTNQFTVYGYQADRSQYGTQTETDPRVLSRAALHAEEFTINVPPVRCMLKKRAGQPAIFIRSGPIRWYRIISFRGLAAVIDPEYNLLTDHRRFSAIHAFSIIFQQRYLNLMYDDVWKLHIDCRSRSEAANPFESDCAAFHITWFRIGPDKKWPEFSNWKSGRLYGTTDEDHLEEVAFTMCFYPSRGSDEVDNLDTLDVFEKPFRTAPERIQYLKESGYWYWCVLVLAPAHFDAISSRYRRPRAINDGGHLEPVRLILEALKDAADSWEAIAEHLTRVINTRGAIFDPDLHDRLLFDDDAFSRSRLYFWAIDSLELFIPTIAANIREWENFWKARKFLLGCYNTGSPGEPPRMLNEIYESVLQQIEEEVSGLAALKARLELLREQIKTLRDGLFNASAVIESRAATELGQFEALDVFQYRLPTT